MADGNIHELIGGDAAVRRIVDRFYDYMASDAAVTELRAMHAADLAPIREKLGDFMIGWLGGAPLYFQKPGARCMGAVHAPYAISAAVREQWLSCMHRALDDEGVSAELQQPIRLGLARMTAAMQER